MNKRAISVTLSKDNLLWLRGRAIVNGKRSLSSTLDEIIDTARLEWFGTAKPTHEMVASNDELFELLERGQGIYVLVYQNEEPTEIFFAGYSFD